MSDQPTPTPNPTPTRTFTEEIELAGRDVVDRVKQLIEEGNVRRLIIRNPDDSVLLEVPLTVGAVVGGALALFNPLIAGLGAIAALVTKVKIEVVREVGDEPSAEVKKDE